MRHQIAYLNICGNAWLLAEELQNILYDAALVISPARISLRARMFICQYLRSYKTQSR